MTPIIISNPCPSLSHALIAKQCRRYTSEADTQDRAYTSDSGDERAVDTSFLGDGLCILLLFILKVYTEIELRYDSGVYVVF